MCHREKEAQGIPILDKLTDFNPMNDSQSDPFFDLALSIATFTPSVYICLTEIEEKK